MARTSIPCELVRVKSSTALPSGVWPKGARTTASLLAVDLAGPCPTPAAGHDMPSKNRTAPALRGKLIVLMALLPPVESFPASSRHRGTVVVEDLHDPASWIRSRPQRPNPPDEREDWPCPGAIWYY